MTTQPTKCGHSPVISAANRHNTNCNTRLRGNLVGALGWMPSHPSPVPHGTRHLRYLADHRCWPIRLPPGPPGVPLETPNQPLLVGLLLCSHWSFRVRANRHWQGSLLEGRRSLQLVLVVASH